MGNQLEEGYSIFEEKIAGYLKKAKLSNLNRPKTFINGNKSSTDTGIKMYIKLTTAEEIVSTQNGSEG